MKEGRNEGWKERREGGRTNPSYLAARQGRLGVRRSRFVDCNGKAILTLF